MTHYLLTLLALSAACGGSTPTTVLAPLACCQPGGFPVLPGHARNYSPTRLLRAASALLPPPPIGPERPWTCLLLACSFARCGCAAAPLLGCCSFARLWLLLCSAVAAPLLGCGCSFARLLFLCSAVAAPLLGYCSFAQLLLLCLAVAAPWLGCCSFARLWLLLCSAVAAPLLGCDTVG